MQDIREEHAIQAFSNMDENYRGFITTLQFYDILTTIKQHLITPFVKENIVTVSTSELRSYGKILDLIWLNDNMVIGVGLPVSKYSDFNVLMPK